MQNSTVQDTKNLTKLSGIVERITFHNPENGWTVMKVTPFKDPTKQVTVLIHQVKVFAGATMEFYGSYTHHIKHGEQFKALKAIEKKPATTAALEKYLGSGLIKGIGPAIAKRVVTYFKDKTLDIFEQNINELMDVPGIAEKKLYQIKTSWEEHRSIRDVMIFLQGHGISTLFATKIYKTYGDKAIQTVSNNPYRLAHDIYGIGFFSADRIALSMGFEKTGIPRIEAGIKHILSASREDGHCFLTEPQTVGQIPELLRETIPADKVVLVLQDLLKTNQVKLRKLLRDQEKVLCYYSNSLYFDELTTAQLIQKMLPIQHEVDQKRVQQWVQRYCQEHNTQLSDEQHAAVCGIASQSFAILTGGPGCGKTTTTKVLFKLLQAMKKHVLLAAPTGRAAQRMTEVIGSEAKTIHRLLEWLPQKGGFKKDSKDPLDCDFLILDETSMLDISLTAALLQAIPKNCQILFIGDPDQLPAVGAGDVLSDLLKSKNIVRYNLTKVFRQAQASTIIRYAHEINSGVVPKIISPLADLQAFAKGNDCLFVDADEATQDQIKFIKRAKYTIENIKINSEQALLKSGDEWLGKIQSDTKGGIDIDRFYKPDLVNEATVRSPVLEIPDKFKHVDLAKLAYTQNDIEELKQVLKNIHPWSSINYGLTALDTIVRLYTKTIPEWLGPNVEIQVLTPQVRGTVGTININSCLQNISNPMASHKAQLLIGDKILRVGDRVIQTRNNYNLGVFNGDIGKIKTIDSEEMSCEVEFSGGEMRSVVFAKDDLSELSLAYAITVHKSQGSEFQAVIIPVMGQHYNMLFRNLIYTGLTRAKKLAVFVGTRKAFAMAVQQIDNRKRQTALSDLIESQTCS